MLKKLIGFVSVIGLGGLAGVTAFAGCSSTVTVTDTDAGTTTTVTDSGGSKVDAKTTAADTGPSNVDSGPNTCYDPTQAASYKATTGAAGQNVCTPAQVTGFFADCIDKTADATKCKAYSDNAANKNCMSCMVGGNYGDGGLNLNLPGLVLTDKWTFLNINLCSYLVLKQPQCTVKASNSLLCQGETCGACEDQASLAECQKTSAADACKDFVQEKACTDALTAGKAAADAVCRGTDFASSFPKTINYLCGPPTDGG